MATVAGEPQDHPHHESLWFAHGDVNGVDFWAGDGRIEVETVAVDARAGAVHGIAIWRDGQGREVCRDHHTVRFVGRRDVRAVDFDLTLIASNGDLRLGDTKEGTFALRLRPELCLRGPGATGSGLEQRRRHRRRRVGQARALGSPTPARSPTTPIVVAIFDHPRNPSHPTWWHARDYGLFAANPFGVHDFTGRAGRHRRAGRAGRRPAALLLPGVSRPRRRLARPGGHACAEWLAEVR